MADNKVQNADIEHRADEGRVERARWLRPEVSRIRAGEAEATIGVNADVVYS